MGHRLYQSIPAEFEFDEDHSYFMVRLPVHPVAREVSEPVGEQVEAQVERSILKICIPVPLSLAEIATALGHKQLSGNLRKDLPRMRDAGLLEYTIPGKPNSRLQKYRLTEKGRRMT